MSLVVVQHESLSEMMPVCQGGVPGSLYDSVWYVDPVEHIRSGLNFVCQYIACLTKVLPSMTSFVVTRRFKKRSVHVLYPLAAID